MTIHKFIDDARPRPQIVIEEASRTSSPSVEEHAHENISPADEDLRISPVELAQGRRPTIEISQPKDIETDLATNDSYLDKLSPGTGPKLRRPTMSKSRNSVRFTDEPPSSIPSTPGSFLEITQQSAPMEPTFNWWSDENAEPIWLQEDVPDPDAEDLPRKISLTPSAIFNLRNTYSEHPGSPPKQTFPALNHHGSEVNLLSASVSQSDTGLGVIDNDFDSISSEHSREEPQRAPSYNPNKGVHRAVSLPFNPDFVSPAFRSIPAWIPLRTVHVATFLVGVTVILSLANIVFSLYVLVNETLPTCTPT